MNVYSNLFSCKKINEGNKIEKKIVKPMLHETNINTIDLPYKPMTSPRNTNKKSRFPSLHGKKY